MITKYLNRFSSSMVFLLLLLPQLNAQNIDNDFLRSTGKIYSVVAGVVLIFLALAIYLWRIDNKLTKLENNIKDEHKTS
jgi:protein-S-isoprenylcysteine O-methyltransferase Ste14